MKGKSVLAVLLTAAVSVSLFGGCQGQKKIKIGAMPADASVGFFQEGAKGMKAAAKKFGVDIDVQYTKRDLAKELSLTETYISQGYDGMVLNASDSAAVSGALQKAKEAKKPIVAVDTVPDNPKLATATVTSDNYSGGKAAGELMKKLIPEGGNIIMTKLNFSSVAMDDRYAGFQDAIEGSNLKIVDTIEQDGTRENAMEKITPLLSKHGDLVGVFCSQGDPAIGVLSAVNTAKLDDKITIISYDVEDEVAAAIENGSAIKGGVAQFPYAMGYLAVYDCINAVNGKKVDNVTKLPVLEVTADNVAEYKKDAVAFLEKYGNVKLPDSIDK